MIKSNANVDSRPVKKIQLLLFMPSSALTGGPRVLLNLLTLLDYDKFDPLVLLLEQGPLVGELENLGVRFKIEKLSYPLKIDEIRRASLSRKFQIVRNCYTFNKRVQNIIRDEGITLLWVRNVKSVLLSVLGANRMSVPVIWDIGLEKPGKGLFKYLHLWGLRRVDWVVTEARRQHALVFGEDIARRYAERILTINPGISQQRIDDILSAVEARQQNVLRGEGRLNILQIGTLCPRKNQLLSIQAIAQLNNESVCLHLLGGTEDLEYERLLQQTVADQSLGGKVKFYGWQDNIPDFLAAADLFLMTSLNEGIPYAVHEAMHASLPVIVSDAGGMPDAVLPKVTGTITPVNDVKALRSAIEGFLREPELLSSMGRAGHEFVTREYSTDKWYATYEQLFTRSIR